MGKNNIISIDKVEYQKWLQNLCDEIDRQRLKAVMQLKHQLCSTIGGWETIF